MRYRRPYGECARSGKVVPLDRLVPDGHLRGLLVADDWYEPQHPQERLPRLSPERHRIPAPELSIPAGEGTEAPAISFDASGKLTFT